MAMTTTNNSNREQVARRLKQTRQDRKLSLGKLSKELRIPESTLRALENPKDKSIPPSHLTGLIKRYADQLGLSPGDIESMLTDLELAQSASPTRRRHRKTRRPIVLSKLTATLVVGVVAITIGGYALLQVYGLASAPDLKVTSPSDYTIVTESAYTVKGQAGADTSVLVNGDPVILNEQGEFSVTIYLQPGRNSLEVSAINNFSRRATVERVIYLESDQ